MWRQRQLPSHAPEAVVAAVACPSDMHQLHPHLFPQICFFPLSLLSKGQDLHSLFLKLQLDYDTFVLNSLINMYFANGSVGSARKVFDLAKDFVKHVVSWNSLISGYLKSDLNGEALWVFGKMVKDCVEMDRLKPVSALTAAGRVGVKFLGRNIHALVVVNGSELDFYLGYSLVSLYARCVDLEAARKVFDGIRVKNLVC